MKFLVLSTDDPEKLRIPPTPAQMAAIGAFTVEAAGHIFLTGGVRPSEAAVRINYTDGKRAVTDGPYAEAKELVAGFAIIDVASRDEAAAEFRRAAGLTRNTRERAILLERADACARSA